MDFRSRVGIAFVLVGCFLGGMVVLDTLGETIFPQAPAVITPGTLIDQVFTRAGFLYGPQSWRPGYNPLGVYPGKDVLDNESWYIMFVDLNATPVSGDPNVKRLGSVRLTYNFTDLNGRAVFAVYGLTTGTIPTRTNRQTGFNNCGYIVTGKNTAGGSMPAANPLLVSGSHQYTIAISNNPLADSYDLKTTTRHFFFNQPGSGEGALHITSSLAKRMGTVTETADQNGTFYVTATGTEPGNTLLLMAAVDRSQPDDFSLHVRTEFVRA